MSMNVYIHGVREITYKNGAGKKCHDRQSIKFDAVQTPTRVTYHIVEQADPVGAYIEYVATLSNPTQEPIYAEDDIWEEGEPIGHQTYDWAQEHIEEFNKWLDTVRKDGYTVYVEVI